MWGQVKNSQMFVYLLTLGLLLVLPRIYVRQIEQVVETGR